MPRCLCPFRPAIALAAAVAGGCTVDLTGLPPGAAVLNPSCVINCQSQQSLATSHVESQGGGTMTATPSLTITQGESESRAPVLPGAHPAAPAEGAPPE